MISIISRITAIAALAIMVGATVASNTTSSPDFEHELWWMLGKKKIEELLKEEDKATKSPFDGIPLEDPILPGPTSTTSTTSSRLILTFSADHVLPGSTTPWWMMEIPLEDPILFPTTSISTTLDPTSTTTTTTTSPPSTPSSGPGGKLRGGVDR
ncbi:hypothetical protein Pmar_PMAR011607 [Perkinsus marinus ATCC 50983]|uniref:Uncharacterized protein n=1 Tax=Perkinsus marinus (strain ATCC 50983 / TXsc) TaxID=423536 RepID=C5LC93_PERM5|nr:hypothetical protein Pmar_PMAR011607 [Perkinsus marinus ATCC 50983]EER05576.1 hypothetical protein Pmar_PMAR011607 [Perkinsus marinus ATCC 50983]|eukprot:XP_002773760.1 hypothetical protein Pmar_PMAR011607 [Perkinsus marinus ATCC 50983]